MTRFLLAAVGCACLIHVSLSPASAQSPSTTLQPIFNGVNLDGWKHSGNWEVVDGVITRTGKGGGLIYTDKKVPDDFELTFQWKVAEGSNSGIHYRPSQIEYQILDNAKHRDGKNPRTSAASLYFCMAPSEDATLPVGQWNQGKVVCQGTIIQHWLNGKKVIDFDYADPKWKFEVDMLRKRGGDVTKRGGSVSLQDHNDPVWYRDIQLRSIPKNEDIGHSDVQPAIIPADTLEAEAKKLEAIIQRQKKSVAK